MAVSCSITPKAIFETTITIAQIATGADGTDQTFTVTGLGLNTADFILVSIPSLNADVMFCNAHVSANDTIKIRFENQSAGNITPGAVTLKGLVF